MYEKEETYVIIKTINWKWYHEKVKSNHSKQRRDDYK